MNLWDSSIRFPSSSNSISSRDGGVLGSSGISWTVCKQSEPCCRQTTTPTPQHSMFYRPDALPDAQPTVSGALDVSSPCVTKTALSLSTSSSLLHITSWLTEMTCSSTPIESATTSRTSRFFGVFFRSLSSSAVTTVTNRSLRTVPATCWQPQKHHAQLHGGSCNMLTAT